MAAVALDNVGKAYRRYRHQRERFFEKVVPWSRPRHELVWVLRNIDFSIERGESVAIIGQNGAGKSTMLKLITGTTRPTEGTVHIAGRIAAILELGIGFHPDFTGRQNVLIAGQLLGLSPEEVDGAMADIEGFAEIGAYFDQPIRTFSSGMQVRLAFSVATAIRPDILIIDEALSVGDAYFQHKCAARIRAFKRQGTTLLFVSHDPVAVKSLCDRAIMLDRGMLAKEGAPDHVLDYYNAIIAKRESEYEIREVEALSGDRHSIRSGDGRAKIKSVDLEDATGQSIRALRSNDAVNIRINFEVRAPLDSITVGFLIRDRLGNDIFGTNTHHLAGVVPPLASGKRFDCVFEIDRLSLGAGHYSISVALHQGDNHLVESHEWWDQALVFQVLRADEPTRIGVVNLPVRGGRIVVSDMLIEQQ